MDVVNYDLIIRGGTIVDGSGAPPYAGDVGVRGGLVAAVGQFPGRSRHEIDARGRLVTPGFVDIHTHYDGQVTWEETITPSSEHGVTTVVMGNCGVGFAPVRPAHRDLLMRVMEGVEDVPEVVMAEGVPWTWETFPQYLDFLAQRSFDIDVAAQVPHSPIRVYVMGERGAVDETSSEQDRRLMGQIVAEAIAAGAIGVTSSRSSGHRLKNGQLAPSVPTDEAELLALADGLRSAGAGVFQLITEANRPPEEEIAVAQRIAARAGRPVSVTVQQSTLFPENWRVMLQGVEHANLAGFEMHAQVFPRPVGVLQGLSASLHPFVNHPSYKAIAHMPLDERVARMRDPAMKAQILSESAEIDPQPTIMRLIESAGDMYVINDPPDYAQGRERCLAALAAGASRDLDEFVYDLLLQEDGRRLLYLPGANYADFNLDAVREMMAHPNSLLALGDGGAHYGLICDASFTTFALCHWTRDTAESERFPLEWIVAELTRRPALAVGLDDRGLIAQGMKADLNVIDYDRLRLFAPEVVSDLPAGGKRLVQHASGYCATIVSGELIRADDRDTGARPGRLVRKGSHA